MAGITLAPVALVGGLLSGTLQKLFDKADRLAFAKGFIYGASSLTVSTLVTRRICQINNYCELDKRTIRLVIWIVAFIINYGAENLSKKYMKYTPHLYSTLPQYFLGSWVGSYLINQAERERR